MTISEAPCILNLNTQTPEPLNPEPIKPIYSRMSDMYTYSAGEPPV